MKCPAFLFIFYLFILLFRFYSEFFYFSWRFRLENLPCLSERLAPLGMMGTQFRAPLKALDTIMLWCLKGFRGHLNFSRKTPVSRATVRLIVEFFPVWIWNMGKLGVDTNFFYQLYEDFFIIFWGQMIQTCWRFILRVELFWCGKIKIILMWKNKNYFCDLMWKNKSYFYILMSKNKNYFYILMWRNKNYFCILMWKNKNGILIEYL